MEQKVKLAAVLADMEQPEQDGALRTFSIQYVKKNGTVGEKLRCRKSGQAAGATTESGRFRYNVKQKGVVVLTNLDNNQSFSLIIAYITHFNGVRVWH